MFVKCFMFFFWVFYTFFYRCFISQNSNLTSRIGNLETEVTPINISSIFQPNSSAVSSSSLTAIKYGNVITAYGWYIPKDNIASQTLIFGQDTYTMMSSTLTTESYGVVSYIKPETLKTEYRTSGTREKNVQYYFAFTFICSD